MKKRYSIPALVIVSVLGLGGCQKNDGVPLVKDFNHPVDKNGKPITQTEFISKYCSGKNANETCSKMISSAQQNSIKGGGPNMNF